MACCGRILRRVYFSKDLYKIKEYERLYLDKIPLGKMVWTKMKEVYRKERCYFARSFKYFAEGLSKLNNYSNRQNSCLFRVILKTIVVVGWIFNVLFCGLSAFLGVLINPWIRYSGRNKNINILKKLNEERKKEFLDAIEETLLNKNAIEEKPLNKKNNHYRKMFDDLKEFLKRDNLFSNVSTVEKELKTFIVWLKKRKNVSKIVLRMNIDGIVAKINKFIKRAKKVSKDLSENEKINGADKEWKEDLGDYIRKTKEVNIDKYCNYVDVDIDNLKKLKKEDIKKMFKTWEKEKKFLISFNLNLLKEKGKNMYKVEFELLSYNPYQKS